VRISLHFNSSRKPNTFNSAVRPIREALTDLSKNQALSIHVADLRPWYENCSLIGKLEGYISIKSGLSDDDLITIIKKVFKTLNNFSSKTEFRILKGKPSLMPNPPRELFPFQWDTDRKIPDVY
jgi:hypothetical protein